MAASDIDKFETPDAPTTGVITRFTPWEQLPEVLTGPEAAAWLNIKVSAFYRAAREGHIKVRRYGRLVRVDKAALKAK